MRLLTKALLGLVLLAATFGATGCDFSIGSCNASGQFISTDGSNGGDCSIGLSPGLSAPPATGFAAQTRVYNATYNPPLTYGVGNVEIVGALVSAFPGATGTSGFFNAISSLDPNTLGFIDVPDGIAPADWSFLWALSDDPNGELCDPPNPNGFQPSVPVLPGNLIKLFCFISIDNVPGGQITGGQTLSNGDVAPIAVYGTTNLTSSPNAVVGMTAATQFSMATININDNDYYYQFPITEDQASDGTYMIDLTQETNVYIDIYDTLGEYWATTWPQVVSPTTMYMSGQDVLNDLNPVSTYTGFIQAVAADGSVSTIGAVSIQTN